MVVTESAGLDERKRVLGIWDMRASPISLGGLLTLAEELQIQRMIHRADLADVCFISNEAYLLPIRGTQADGDWRALSNNEAFKDSELLSALLNIEHIGTCYLCGSIGALQGFLRASPCPYVTWPVLNEKEVVTHGYASTMFVQSFYCDNGFIPHLSCRREPIQWAMDFLERSVMPNIPVTVHLKNNPAEPGASNADLDAWLTFLTDCNLQYDVTFILIGNEDIDPRMRRLPNAVVARDFGSNLSRDLALIETACIFMGMASGPCNMALFSETPYIIFKNPDHHAEEMALELGNGDRFPFASPLQKVLRVLETNESLTSEFGYLYTHVDRQDWQRRLAKLYPQKVKG